MASAQHELAPEMEPAEYQMRIETEVEYLPPALMLPLAQAKMSSQMTMKTGLVTIA